MMCGKEFPVALAMIQPEPFPGSFRHDGMPFEEIVAVSLKEIEMIQDNGFDGYIIQNIHYISGALEYYLSGLKHWNEALVYCVKEIEKYTGGSLVQQWKEAVEDDAE